MVILENSNSAFRYTSLRAAVRVSPLRLGIYMVYLRFFHSAKYAQKIEVSERLWTLRATATWLHLCYRTLTLLHRRFPSSSRRMCIGICNDALEQT